MGLLIIFALVSIIFSFLCSIWEAVLLSIPASYVEIEAEKKTNFGTSLKAMKDNIDRPLSAILTLNTLAHTAGAMGVGMQAGVIWSDSTPMINWDLGFMHLTLGGEAIIGALMTLAILLLSEIIPKTIGASYWKSLTGFTVTSLKIIMFILAPLVWVSEKLTKFLKAPGHGSVLSRQDFQAMANISAKEGVIKKSESKIINNLLTFNAIKAKDIMTPRTVVMASDGSKTINQFFKETPNLRFSRIPIFKGNKDNITGFILKDELLLSIIDNRGEEPLNSLSREIRMVSEEMSLPELFNQLMEKKEHISLVVGKFGGMSGIVSMEDVIETLLGMEIIDEMDGIEDMQILARNKWAKRAQSLGMVDDKGNSIVEKKADSDDSL